MYHKDRRALLHTNVFTLLQSDPKREYHHQLLRATNFTCSTLRLMKTLRAGLLEPRVLYFQPAKSHRHLFERFIRWVPPSLSCYAAQMFKAYPLDMSQYLRLFNTTRIPGRGKDRLLTHEESRHVVVMRKGNMYAFDVIDRDGNLLKPAEIQAHLEHILNDLTPATDFPVGVLGMENRDVFAHLRDKLIRCGNADTLRIVESAIFCLCLDDRTPQNCDDMWLLDDIKNGNRWLDKSFNLCVSKSGEVGAVLEHSWGDGMTISNFLDVICKDSTEQPQVHPGSAPAAVDSAAAVRRLQFNLDGELKDGIKKAQEGIGLAESQLYVDFITFRKGGKETLKKHNVSPDCMVQLAVQMGFLRRYGQTVPTSESCSTATFKHGRLEVMATVTMSTKECAHAFVFQRDQHSVQQLKAGLYRCSDLHRRLISEASRGELKILSAAVRI